MLRSTFSLKTGFRTVEESGTFFSIKMKISTFAETFKSLIRLELRLLVSHPVLPDVVAS